jgi:AI-2 transport protein TqsA
VGDTGAVEGRAAPRIVAIAAAVVILFGARQASTVIAPALTALLVAIAFVPLQRWLGHRIGRTGAFILTLLLVLTIIAGLVALVLAGVAGLADALPRHAGLTDEVSEQARTLLVPSGTELGRIIDSLIQQVPEQTEYAVSAAGAAAKGVADFGIVVLLAAFMLADAIRLREKTTVLDEMSRDSVRRIERTVSEIRTYLKVTGVMGVSIGALTTVLYLVVGVELALLWGVLIMVGAFVPYVGLWAALLPPVLLTTLDRGLNMGIVVALGALLISGAVSNIVKPMLLANGLNLSPFTVLFSVVFWAYILGPLGAILAVPLTLAVKELVFDQDPGMGWMSTLMGHRMGEEHS